MKEKKNQPVAAEEPSLEPTTKPGDSPLMLAVYLLGIPLGVIILIMAIQTLL